MTVDRPRGNRKVSKIAGRRATPGEWQPVWRGGDEATASLISGALESDGLRTRLSGTPGYPAAYVQMQTGTWTVFCRGGEASRARLLLRRRGETGVIDHAPTGLSPDWRTSVVLAVIMAGGALLLGLYAELLR